MRSSSKTVALVLMTTASAAGVLHCGGDDTGGPSDAGADMTLVPLPDSGGGGGDATLDGSVGYDAGGSTDGGSAGDTGATSDDAGTPDGSQADGGLDAGPTEAGLDAEVDAGHPCDAAAQCGDAATLACCAGQCTDTSRDPNNCGVCGTACGATKFCTGTACDDAVFANVCGNPAATVVWDMYATDNDAGNVVGAALAANCAPPTTISQQIDEALVVEPGTGRPLLGVGDTYLIGGGWFGHAGINYMDMQTLTHVQVNGDGVMYSWIKNLVGPPNTYVVDVLTSSLTATNDYFLVELAVEPISGTLCFAATGMLGPGTTAAGWYAANVIIPQRATYTDSWYAYHWQDTDSSGGPSAGDMFTQLASGK